MNAAAAVGLEIKYVTQVLDNRIKNYLHLKLHIEHSNFKCPILVFFSYVLKDRLWLIKN